MATDDRSARLQSNDTKPTAHGLPPGAIVGIVIGCILLIILLAVGSFFVYRRLRNRRKHHGVYRPQLEENLHARELPPVAPPSIDGLI
ncbi:Crb-3 [Aphelenchoides besseyi]|nr:Crb-3 [Aphelenchoides besseyi]KAI6232478.1 Crb-3 [Aphelenchoides besseyi]